MISGATSFIGFFSPTIIDENLQTRTVITEKLSPPKFNNFIGELSLTGATQFYYDNLVNF